MFTVLIKSGTSDHFEQDDIDLKITTIDSNNIPNKGDILDIAVVDMQFSQSYVVNEIRRKYVKTASGTEQEFINVYVYKI